MADHSVDHREPTTWWANATVDEWTHEVMDQKTSVAVLHLHLREMGQHSEQFNYWIPCTLFGNL